MLINLIIVSFVTLVRCWGVGRGERENEREREREEETYMPTSILFLIFC